MAKDPKKPEIESMNDEIDATRLDADDLEDVTGGGCSGCHGIYRPDSVDTISA